MNVMDLRNRFGVRPSSIAGGEWAYREYDVLRVVNELEQRLVAPAPALPEEQNDKVRLDFIEADHRLHLTNSSEMIDRGFMLARWAVVAPLPHDRGFEKIGEGDTLRAAIDAALRSIQGGE